MPCNTRRSSKRNKFFFCAEGGFSVIEAIIALAIFSILGVTLLSVTVSAIRALEEANSGLQAMSQVSLLETDYRAKISAIRIPFWLAEFPEYEDFSRLFIPYYQGDYNKSVLIEFDDERITLSIVDTTDETIEESRFFDGIDDVSWEMITTDKEDEIIGVSFTFQRSGGTEKPVTVVERFGSVPLENLYE